MLIGERHFVNYWQSTLDEVAALQRSPVRRVEMPLRSNELSTAWAFSFTVLVITRYLHIIWCRMAPVHLRLYFKPLDTAALWQSLPGKGETGSF